ncbi:Putative phage-encoded peptidoglycan binding protein [hydrothermal vent metagenome]|uniref:Putative phage-encoded peptidoglycan binding protein n=1 Tax=hydrothermal vent metagenome TaxID=652676 RepID=A0A1W1EKD6_9ZZZZ
MLSLLRKGSSKKESVILLQTLLNQWGCRLRVDGDFGDKTLKCVKEFQLNNNLIVDGVVGAKSWTVFQQEFPSFFQSLRSKFISENDIIQASKILGVDVATVKAVYKVESNGKGFIGDNPKILFEGHVFWRQLKKHGINPYEHQRGNEDILFPRWTRKYYRQNQYIRLEKAKEIDKSSALESASWGLFQIMGYHWKSLGYNSVEEFVEKMYQNEGEQLLAFVKFIEVNGLTRFLKVRDWAGFARRYNGRGYRANRYDIKLARAYRKYR